MKKNLQKIAGILLTSTLGLTGFAQQQISVYVAPTVSLSIEGHKELSRAKYFNLATTAAELKKSVLNYDENMADYYINELGITVGRKLSMVKGETYWGNSLKEDASREGYTDLDYFKNKKAGLNDEGMNMLQAAFGDNQNVVCHESSDPYPDYMDLYTVEGSNGHKYPADAASAAELIATILKYGYTDFQRPAYYELMNEPHWKHFDDKRFIDLHVKTKEKVVAEGVNTQIGGPCSSVSNYHKNEYKNLGGITNFMSNTDFKLDFYSFHSYDYMHWDDDANDFVGSINSGLPLEGVLDACAAFCNNAGHDFKYLTSEHGGYINDVNNRDYALEKLGQLYFPGSGFDYEMEKRNIDNFIMVNSAIANTMTYMNHPHVVLKSVPFILLESAGWNTEYYSSLLVKENFDKNSSVWRESRLIDFYKFFKGVKGRRVETYCDDTDIQHHAFVSDRQLILLFHNQSNQKGAIDVHVEQFVETPSEISIRRLRRKEDFRPEMIEETVASLSALKIGGQESVAVFVNYSSEVPEEEEIPVKLYYSSASDIGVQFSGSRNFSIRTLDYKYIKEAELRIGISRKAANSKEVKIYFNGTELLAPVEDCADRLTGDFYATTKIVKVPGSLLKTNNTIQVNFPDGKSGGVGAAVLRAKMGDDVSVRNLKYHKNKLNIFPNPSDHEITVSSNKEGVIEIIGLDGRLKKSVEASVGDNKFSIEDLMSGTFIVQLVTGKDLYTNKLLVY
ncbi:T9SS type A sorting domain-containing protein [Saccharicrinis fermentans]|uniref:Uncharacterized protein n=1 Tax=Saccharicrinis fermentans DSM 9555 = JCM 21142 TaxID=869213 RepID=W7Y3W1_9BACT|nr:T9SS type A sorting domain-containing protein [Saccharicrinis fermentans]GAF02722.1 hypothetical protein JCM21142_31363 [Saccharicrinis fermentans DSM 9555 = JCM 21142]